MPDTSFRTMRHRIGTDQEKEGRDVDTMKREFVPEQYAAAIRGGRAARGYSVRQVSEGTGIPVWRITSLERGQITPKPGEFSKLWSFLSTGEPQGK
jgi:ribosome-binding protein aMBF1 (putative translation factor)